MHLWSELFKGEIFIEIKPLIGILFKGGPGGSGMDGPGGPGPHGGPVPRGPGYGGQYGGQYGVSG